MRIPAATFPKPLPPEEEQHCLLRAVQGDLEARNALITHNLRLVSHIMKKYYAGESDHEDLISIGTIGLIKAVSTYRLDKKIRLATYASRCIENEILMYFRSQRKRAQDVSLSDCIESAGEGNALCLMDVVCQEEDVLEKITRREEVLRLRQALGICLTGQEYQVVALRYGLCGGPEKRQREVAEVLGISRSYVSRIEKRALEKLKQALTS